jgi:hypothetical protein
VWGWSQHKAATAACAPRFGGQASRCRGGRQRPGRPLRWSGYHGSDSPGSMLSRASGSWMEHKRPRPRGRSVAECSAKFERGGSQRATTVEAIQRAFEDAGVIFIEASDGGPGARPALHHGKHSARHHVRPAEPRTRWGSGDLEASRGGNRGSAIHLCRSLRSNRRGEHLSQACADGMTLSRASAAHRLVVTMGEPAALTPPFYLWVSPPDCVGNR